MQTSSPIASSWLRNSPIDRLVLRVYRFKIHNGLLSIDNNYTLDALSLSAIVIVDAVVLFFFAISHTQPILNFIFMIIGSTSSTIYRYFLHTHSKQFRRQRSKKIKRQRQHETLEVQQTFFFKLFKIIYIIIYIHIVILSFFCARAIHTMHIYHKHNFLFIKIIKIKKEIYLKGFGNV